MLPRRESLPAVTAAAVVAIIFGAFGVLGGLLIEASMLLMPEARTSAGRPAIPPGARTMAGIVWLFLIAVAVFGIFVGVGIVRRRNWARISLLVWGGLPGCGLSNHDPGLILPIQRHAGHDAKGG
jgi:hypothetical protein